MALWWGKGSSRDDALGQDDEPIALKKHTGGIGGTGGTSGPEPGKGVKTEEMASWGLKRYFVSRVVHVLGKLALILLQGFPPNPGFDLDLNVSAKRKPNLTSAT